MALLSPRWLLSSGTPVQADRGGDSGRERGQKRSRSRSRSKDRHGETNPQHRRKRPSRWSDHPPNPPDGSGSAGGDRGREAAVDRPPTDEPVVGDIYKGKVCSIMQFGCFVQLEGLRSVYKFHCFQSFKAFNFPVDYKTQRINSATFLHHRAASPPGQASQVCPSLTDVCLCR